MQTNEYSKFILEQNEIFSITSNFQGSENWIITLMIILNQCYKLQNAIDTLFFIYRTVCLCIQIHSLFSLFVCHVPFFEAFSLRHPPFSLFRIRIEKTISSKIIHRNIIRIRHINYQNKLTWYTLLEISHQQV